MFSFLKSKQMYSFTLKNILMSKYSKNKYEI